jgi:hypothetical protein
MAVPEFISILRYVRDTLYPQIQTWYNEFLPVITNMDEILLADTNAQIATAMAEVCTNTYDQFDDRYLGAKATAPIVDNDGNALVYGTLYFDTTENFMKVWSNAGWINAGSSVNGTTERYVYTASEGQTVFVATYEAGYIDVFLNGSKLQNGVDFTAVTATDITLTSPASAGDVIDIVCYAVFELSTAPTKDVVAYTIDTIDDFVSIPSSYTTAIVKDLNRGGTFIWSSTGTANGGTVFAGATGYWIRQYDGDVNVKWFGAKGDGTTDNSVVMQKCFDSNPGEVVYTDGIYIQHSVELNYPVKISCLNVTIKLKAITELERKPLGTTDWTLAFPCFYLYSDDVSFIRCNFDLNNWNQIQDGVYRSDNVIAHRTLTAITSMDTDVNNLTIDGGIIENGFNAGVVLSGGTNHIVINNNFRNLSTGSIFNGIAQPSVETSHWVDGYIFNNNIVSNIGVRTSELDTRDYGHSLPSVTGDGMLHRGKNIYISNSYFYNVDRSAIKTEQPKSNIHISNVISENTNYSDGKRFGQAIQFSTVSSGYEGTPDMPNNFSIKGCVAGVCTFVGGIYGVEIANNTFNITDASNAIYWEGNILITINGSSQSGGFLISNNILRTNQANKHGIKLASSNGGIFGFNILNNYFDVARTDFLLSSSIETDGNFIISGNQMWHKPTNTATSIDLGSKIFNGMVITNNQLFRIDARSGDYTKRIGMVVTNNICQQYITVEALDIVATNNVIMSKSGNNLVDTAKKYPSVSYFQADSGAFHIATDLDATPNVRGLKNIRVTNSVATSISNFLNGTDTHEIVLFCTNGNTSILNNATINTSTNTTTVVPANGTISFIFYNGRWYENTRSF